MHRRLWWMGVCRDEEKESGGGGGGEKPLSKADIEKLISDQVNGAIKRVETAGAKQAKALEDKLGAISELLEGKKKEGAGGGDENPTEKKGGDPDVNARLDQITRELAREKGLREKAEKDRAESEKKAQQRALDAEIATAIGAHKLATPGTITTVSAYLRSLAKFDDQGRVIISGENGDIPVANFLAGYISENPNLLEPKPAGGGGTGKGSQSGSGFDTARIKPGMTREDSEAALQEIRKHFPGV